MFVIYSCLNDCCQKSVPCQISLHISSPLSPLLLGRLACGYGGENLLKILYCRLFYLVVVIGHNKLCTASGCKRSLAGPKCQLYIYCWPKVPAIYLLLTLKASKMLKFLKLARKQMVKSINELYLLSNLV